MPPEAASRAIAEYLAVLDDEAFGATMRVTPKFISPADPASRWTGANKGLAFFAYATNYPIDLNHAVIIDVDPSTAVRTAEVTAARTMIERVHEQHNLLPNSRHRRPSRREAPRPRHAAAHPPIQPRPFQRNRRRADSGRP